MYQKKWDDLLDKIEKLFGFIDHDIEEFPERSMTVETAVFDGDSGRMKLERTVKPLLLEKKVSFSKRIGSDAEVEYIYSEDETVDIVKFYKWDRLRHTWKQIEMDELGR
jgi:hypothetical protein